jgi:hypothetical protein
MILRTILILILIYFIYKIGKIVYLILKAKNNAVNNFKNNPPSRSKYKDVQEINYTEIESKKNQHED